MKNILNNLVEAGLNSDHDIKSGNIKELIKSVFILALYLILSAMIGQYLWNTSVQKLFPMLGKSGLYDVLLLHLLINII